MNIYSVWLYKNGEKYFRLVFHAKNRHSAEETARLYGLPIGAIDEYSGGDISELSRKNSK